MYFPEPRRIFVLSNIAKKSELEYLSLEAFNNAKIYKKHWQGLVEKR
jgi:hypothetical protein